MKVLVDDRWYGPTGIGRYAAEIIKRAPEFVDIEEMAGNWPIRSALNPVYLGRAVRRSKPDLFWSPGFMPPIWPKAPFAITIHDLIHRRFGGKAYRVYYDYVIRPLARRARVILTVSEYAKGEILSWTGLSSERVIAIPHGVSDEFGPAGRTWQLGEPYLLYVGNRRVHKNIARMMEAFAVSGAGEGVLLALSGVSDVSTCQLVDQNGLTGRVVFLGDISERELPAVYRGALGLVNVSLHEGFGFPVLEAMACGTAVIASKGTALPEVAGDAAMLVDPADTASIARAMTRLVSESELRAELSRRGVARARLFSWERSAEKTWRALVDAV